ncbi:hypothetical protein N5P37_005641, partial [Trichoderma harzianum]
IICLFFALLSVSLRLYTKSRILNGNKWEDYLMYFAFDKKITKKQLLYSMQSAFVIYGVVLGGVGQPVSRLTSSQISIALQSWYAGESIYGPLSALVRTSIGIFIMRLSAKTTKAGSSSFILWVSLSLTWGFTVVYLFINIFQCSPVSFYWKQFEEQDIHGSCSNSKRVPIAAICHSVVAALCDFVLGFLPAWTLWGAQLGPLRRLGLIILLSFGMLAGFVMLVRIPFIRILEVSTDFLSETVDVAICSIIEPCLGIVAGCLPAIWCLREKFRQWRFGQVQDHNTRDSVPIDRH